MSRCLKFCYVRIGWVLHNDGGPLISLQRVLRKNPFFHPRPSNYVSTPTIRCIPHESSKYAIVLPRCWAHVMVVHNHWNLDQPSPWADFFQGTLPLDHYWFWQNAEHNCLTQRHTRLHLFLYVFLWHVSWLDELSAGLWKVIRIQIEITSYLWSWF